MAIENKKYVAFEYVLKDAEGELIETSEDYGTMAYIHGQEMLIPGLEEAMAGKNEGDSFKVTVEPEKGYGDWDEELVTRIPKDQFGEDAAELEPGMEVEIEDEESGELYIMMVVDIDEDQVVVDGNHPYAGVTLEFDVKITEVRDATEEDEALFAEAENCEDEGCGCDCGCSN